MLLQLWLERRVQAKWITHSALPPLPHSPRQVPTSGSLYSPSARVKQELWHGQSAMSRKCGLFRSDPAFEPEVRQHWFQSFKSIK